MRSTLTETFFDGSIDYNGVIPISDATGTYNIPTLSYYHSFDIFGRSANVVASLPYTEQEISKGQWEPKCKCTVLVFSIRSIAVP